jgi:hypothetical protein
MKLLVVALGIVAAIWVGYALCSYRAYGVLVPELARSQRASTALVLVRFVDVLDRGELAPLRAKLLAVAKENTLPDPPSFRFSFGGFLLGPFETSSGAIGWTRKTTDENLVEISSNLARLCQTSPQTDSYKFICGR